MECKLLTITDEYVGVPSPEAYHIPQFKRIVDRDNTKNKEQASRELAYVYYMVDWESPYAPYKEEKRRKLLKEDLFDEEWEPDEAIKEAIEKYRELYENDYIKMLQSARAGARELQRYFEKVDLEETDDKGKLKYKATDLMRNLKEVGNVIEGLTDLVEQVKKNQTKANENRGNVETNKYSR